MRKRSRLRHYAGNILIAIVFAVLTLALFEFGIRLYSGDLSSLPAKRYGGLELEILESSYPATYDPLLGFVPKPGTYGRDNAWGTELTITSDSLRSNGKEASPRGVPILAVGNSFTFGDESDDDQTWPAHLEKILKRPVLNGGVFGYGFDQIVLRAEKLLEKFEAEVLVVSVVPEDLLRCEYSYRYAWKPYFDIVDGHLVLRNVPVPEQGALAPQEFFAERLIRKSHFANYVMMRLDPGRWEIPDSIRIHRRGAEVSRLLIDRLVELGEEQKVRVLFVVQWGPPSNLELARPAIERARATGFDNLVLQPILERLLPQVRDERERYSPFFHLHETADGEVGVGHMNSHGNRMVAQLIAGKLVKMGVVPEVPREARAEKKP